MSLKDFIEKKKGDTVIDGDYQFTLIKKGLSMYYSVSVVDKTKETYAPIPTSFDGIPVKSMVLCFDGCTNLKESPKIPDGIKNMAFAYMHCTSLKEMPEIPKSVNWMRGTFKYCSSLEKTTEIPKGVEDTKGIFEGCPLLEQQVANDVLDNEEEFNISTPTEEQDQVL